MELGLEVRHEKDRDGRKITLYGKTQGKQCMNCKHYYRDVYSKPYPRCVRYPNKHWHAFRIACGFFEEA